MGARVGVLLGEAGDPSCRRWLKEEPTRARVGDEYEQTFEAHNVNFLPLAALAEAELAAAERCALQRLCAYKIRGPSGYPREWLQGIKAEQVIEIVREALCANRITHRWLI
ncbi:MAG: hypothetical protein VBE63_14760 [Lamprobacter sp.]|uniref:hypothetical protein n=1 Tax=Lamprobacter sp. TaxID=3100796 RepID=UPI002B2583B0|nr:hypothetical protein [Lamprobacter sp.]MEA3641183.1 hypothetical protein [Lamprobacter sp.]